MMGQGLRIGSGLAAALFAVAGALQLNDPDPLRWAAVYAAAAVLSGVAALRSVPAVALLALAAIALIWAVTFVPAVVDAAALTGTEQERELAGLVLVGVWMLVLWRGQGASGGP